MPELSASPQAFSWRWWRRVVGRGPRHPASSTLLLRIDQNPIVNQDDQVVLVVARNVGNDRLAWLGQSAVSPTKSPLLEYGPAVGRNQLVKRIENDQIEVVPGGFKENQVPSARRYRDLPK